jgi:CO dehydrogenase maturation factor
VGRLREEAKSEIPGMTSGISKMELLRLKIAESLVEARNFDLIAMGRPEGAVCYCYANNVLKSVILEISGQYPYVVLDNEAGLENLSCRIVQKVNMLVLVSDASNAGLETLRRLYELAREMKIEYDRLVLVVNRIRSGALPPKAEEIKAATGANDLIGLPDDGEVAAFAEEGKPLIEVPDGNAVAGIINHVVKGL